MPLHPPLLGTSRKLDQGLLFDDGSPFDATADGARPGKRLMDADRDQDRAERD